jgi:hypothetical protein
MRPVMLHSPRLATGSAFQNFVLEQLAADPVDPGVGRVWTTTDGTTIKFTTLVGGNIVVNSVSSKAELDAAIEDLDTELRDYIGTEISKLNGAFIYISEFAPGVDVPNTFDLDTLPVKLSGSYYKAANDGYVTFNAVAKFLKAGDAIVFNSVGGYDVNDNSNTEVQGTADEITVTGSTDTGFVISLHATLKATLTTLSTTLTTLSGHVDNVKTAAGLSATGTLAAFTGANFIGAEASLRAALVKLDTELARVEEESGAGLVVELNSRVSRYTAAEALTVHTIPHSFGTDMLSVSVSCWDETAQRWYNDVVGVSHNATNVIIESDSAQIVRVIIENKTAIAE